MKRLILILLILTCSVSVYALPSLIVHYGEGLGQNGGTTSTGIDTSGANLIVVNITTFSAGAFTFSDSKSNTWTALTQHAEPGNATQQLFYCFAPTVGTGHTFTVTGSNVYCAVTVVAFSGISSSPFDVESGAVAGSVMTVASGTITPSQSNTVVITGECVYGGLSSVASIDNAFTISDNIPYFASSAVYVSSSLAYKILTTAAATSATWTESVLQSGLSAGIASFKYASGASPTPAPLASNRFFLFPQ